MKKIALSILLCLGLLLTSCINGINLPAPGTTTVAPTPTTTGVADSETQTPDDTTSSPEDTTIVPEDATSEPDVTTDVPETSTDAPETTADVEPTNTLRVEIVPSGTLTETDCCTYDEKTSTYKIRQSCTVKVSGSAKDVYFYVNANDATIKFIFTDVYFDDFDSFMSVDNAGVVHMIFAGTESTLISRDTVLFNAAGANLIFESMTSKRAPVKMQSAYTVINCNTVTFKRIACDMVAVQDGMFISRDVTVEDSDVIMHVGARGIFSSYADVTVNNSNLDITGQYGISAFGTINISNSTTKVSSTQVCIASGGGIVISGPRCELLSESGDCLLATGGGTTGQIVMNANECYCTAPHGAAFFAFYAAIFQSQKVVCNDASIFAMCTLFSAPSTVFDVTAKVGFDVKDGILLDAPDGTQNTFRFERFAYDATDELTQSADCAVFMFSEPDEHLFQHNVRFGNTVFAGQSNIKLWNCCSVVFGPFSGEEKNNYTSSFEIQGGEYTLYDTSDMSTPVLRFKLEGAFTGLTIGGLALQHGRSYKLVGPTIVEWTQSEDQLYVTP